MSRRLATAARAAAQPPVAAMDGRMFKPIAESAFAAWLDAAGAGDRLVYHVGHLGFDRADGSALSRDRRRELARVADRALALAERGALILTQQRIDDERAAYLAIKAKGRVQ